MSTMENLVLGALAVLLLFWIWPGIKPALEKGKQSPADWPSVITPLGLVIIFVIFLLYMV